MRRVETIRSYVMTSSNINSPELIASARGIFVGDSESRVPHFRFLKMQRLKEGDFVYCKIMAWEGALGLVPKEADGCVMWVRLYF